MKIKWLITAVSDLHALKLYIAEDNPIAAQRVTNRIHSAIALLVDHPGIGRVGRIPNTRELIISGTPYIVPYQVKNDFVEILGVLHGSMEWPAENIEQKILEEVN